MSIEFSFTNDCLRVLSTYTWDRLRPGELSLTFESDIVFKCDGTLTLREVPLLGVLSELLFGLEKLNVITRHTINDIYGGFEIELIRKDNLLAIQEHYTHQTISSRFDEFEESCKAAYVQATEEIERQFPLVRTSPAWPLVRDRNTWK